MKRTRRLNPHLNSPLLPLFAVLFLAVAACPTDVLARARISITNISGHKISFYAYDSLDQVCISPSDSKGDVIQQTITLVDNLNLQPGISNSLDSRLNAALGALADINQNNDVAAINSLEAFINAVEAQRGKHISDTDADTLVAAAEQVIASLTS